tara:strand:+ start:2225 stop:2587 length:363 start_codon:yes stop_codon:yes gene_type:complete
MKKFNEFVAEANWTPNLNDPEVIVYDNGMTNRMIMAGMMNVSTAMRQYGIDKGYTKGITSFFKIAQEDSESKVVKVIPKWRKERIKSVAAEEGEAEGAKEKNRKIEFQLYMGPKTKLKYK